MEDLDFKKETEGDNVIVVDDVVVVVIVGGGGVVPSVLEVKDEGEMICCCNG